MVATIIGILLVIGYFWWKKGDKISEVLNLAPKPTDKDVERLTLLANKLENEAKMAVQIKAQKDRIAKARKTIAESRAVKQSMF